MTIIYHSREFTSHETSSEHADPQFLAIFYLRDIPSRINNNISNPVKVSANAYRFG